MKHLFRMLLASCLLSAASCGTGDGGETPAGGDEDAVDPRKDCASVICDDLDPCTTDQCVPGTGCTFTSKADGATCEDGDLCTTGDTCAGGECTPGEALSCEDAGPDDCVARACNPDTGACDATSPRKFGSPCNDGNACTNGDVCGADGTCSGGTPHVCKAELPCTKAKCNPGAAKGADPCVVSWLDEGTPCDDGDPCTGQGTCEPKAGGGGELECAPGKAKCDDGDVCTADTCKDDGACVFAPGPDGVPCSENPQFACQSGICACAPACQGKQCGADGCGGLCGACANPCSGAADDPSLCLPDGKCAVPCCPACGGKQCGSDGCGGSCGICSDPCTGKQAEGLCKPDGTCEKPCCPTCAGKDCGDDGCGGACGDCTNPCTGLVDASLCDAGTCSTPCCPACAGKACGDDGCGGSCGDCPGVQDKCVSGNCVCQPACKAKECGGDGCGGSCGKCADPCTGAKDNPALCQAYKCTTPCCPVCTGKECGSDGCGGSCGPCPNKCTAEPDDPSLCTAAGLCTGACCPKCAGKECGADGCGDVCGICPFQHDCEAGKCVCKPSCAGKQCGGDGCGGSCGSCSDPLICEDWSGKCVCDCFGEVEKPVCHLQTGTTYESACGAECKGVTDLVPGACEPCWNACTAADFSPKDLCGVDGKTYGDFCHLQCIIGGEECTGLATCPELAYQGKCADVCWVEDTSGISVGDPVPAFVCKDLNPKSPTHGGGVSSFALKELVWIAYFAGCG